MNCINCERNMKMTESEVMMKQAMDTLSNVIDIRDRAERIRNAEHSIETNSLCSVAYIKMNEAARLLQESVNDLLVNICKGEKAVLDTFRMCGWYTR